jgi:hypothetical protein
MKQNGTIESITVDPHTKISTYKIRVFSKGCLKIFKTEDTKQFILVKKAKTCDEQVKSSMDNYWNMMHGHQCVFHPTGEFEKYADKNNQLKINKVIDDRKQAMMGSYSGNQDYEYFNKIEALKNIKKYKFICECGKTKWVIEK